MPRTPRAASIAHTRHRLVEAARELFAEKGYTATGLAEILARANANSGSFYHFFESKDALLRAVLETYAEALEPEILAGVRTAAHEPMDEVRLLLASYRERLAMTECAYGCPIGRLALEIDAENRPAHGLIALNFEKWTAAVADALARAGIPEPGDVAVFVLTVMEGAVMQARSTRSLAPFDVSVRQLMAYIRGLQPRAASRRRAQPVARRRK